MIPKVKEPKPPKPAMSPADTMQIVPEETSSYSTMIATSPKGLTRKANTSKKTLLGGA